MKSRLSSAASHFFLQTFRLQLWHISYLFSPGKETNTTPKHSTNLVFLLLLMAVLGLAQANHITGDKLNIPGDFPSNFGMDLLSGIVAFDVPASGDSIASIGLNTNESSIDFTAGAFDGVGAGAGTSDLSVDVNNYAISSGLFFGYTATFFIDGSRTSVLIDNGDGTGQWSINVPLFADWGPNLGMSLGTISLSTASTVDYLSYIGVGVSTPEIASGSSLDYHTGDAFLVGQGRCSIPAPPFTGVRITMGLAGNDPVAVPLPSAAWLFGTGLIGLIGIATSASALNVSVTSMDFGGGLSVSAGGLKTQEKTHP